jgi:hypothetical protein
MISFINYYDTSGTSWSGGVSQGELEPVCEELLEMTGTFSKEQMKSNRAGWCTG